MACIIALGIVVILMIRWYSARKVRRGQDPVPLTGWMLPPSYHQSQRQYNQPTRPSPEGAPVPPYQPEPGAHDAGYYDANGNFIFKHEQDDFPQAHVREERDANQTPINSEQPSATDFYPPPAGPPPGHQGDTQNYSPPPGPPPAAATR